MPAVIGEDGRKLEPGNRGVLPGTVKYAGNYDLMPLVKCRKSVIQPQVGVVYRAEIAVEIRRGIEGLAVRVIGEKREMVAESPL
jgi:hypothetical protein